MKGRAKARAGRSKDARESSESLDELLTRLDIEDWDIILVGDGSGSDRRRAAGWGTIAVCRDRQDRPDYFVGCINRGTVNFAEVMAYAHALDMLTAVEVERRAVAGAPTKAVVVHIVSDSDYVRRIGTKEGREVNRNAGLWACFAAYARLGFVLHWHWIGRDTDALNRKVDALSKLSRTLMKRYALRGIMESESEEEASSSIREIVERRPRRRGDQCRNRR